MPGPGGIRLPKLRMHRSSGQGVVTLSGHDHYLGGFGTAACRQKYDELIGRWVAGGRRALAAKVPGGTTVATLAAAYEGHILQAHAKRGKPSAYGLNCRRAMRALARLYGSMKTGEFAAHEFRVLRVAFIPGDDGTPNSRTTVNMYADHVRLAFRWGSEEGFVPQATWTELSAIGKLKAGKSAARETGRVGPADEHAVAAVLAAVRGPAADLLRVMRYTGMRPAEACAIRAPLIDRSGSVWVYRVEAQWNKTAHRGIARTVAIGPRAKEILARRMERLLPADGPVFRTQLGRPYTPGSLCSIVVAACKRTGVTRWTPNQLRHSFATEARRVAGLEGARVCLGHERIQTTTVYAERDAELAGKVVEQIG
jgi:integrase